MADDRLGTAVCAGLPLVGELMVAKKIDMELN